MKKTNITYWIFTILFAALMIFSSVPDAISSPEAIAFFKQLSLPSYLLPFLGIAKIIGVIAVLIPGYPLIKEWAYAGLFFDLVGATYCIIGAGMATMGMLFMILPFTLLFGSYLFYHKKLRSANS